MRDKLIHLAATAAVLFAGWGVVEAVLAVILMVIGAGEFPLALGTGIWLVGVLVVLVGDMTDRWRENRG